MHVVDLDTFKKYIQQGVDAIPKQFQKEFNNVVFLTEDIPNEEQRKKIKLEHGLLLFGLYEGIPLNKRPNYYSSLPDRITIFKRPIEYFSRNEDHLKRIVKNTVWHEVAHHFGMNEFEVREAERKRGHSYK